MKYFILIILLISVTTVFAQKNLVPVSKSEITGISLPPGSRKDIRIMSTAGAKLLLELESDKMGVKLSETEVLVLPPVIACGFNKDSLTIILSNHGWKIIPVQGDDKYLWLQRDKRAVILYFSTGAKESSLYLAESSPIPEQKSAENKIRNQPVTSENNPNKQPVNPPVQNNNDKTKQSDQPAIRSGFTFTTTNFDDGWTSNVKEDWVEVAKAGIKVLLHYTTSAIDVSSSDYKTIANNAWNTLVAPRYSNLLNFNLFPGSADYERPYFVSGDVTENTTGQKVYVVLFKKGNSGWIEFISPDKNSFIQSFGIDIGKVDFYAESSLWDPLKKMSGYNRFAVASGDLPGKWTNNFTGIQQYVNVYTAADAGMKTHSSSENFVFETNGSYKWELNVASGFVGSIKFEGVKSTGNFSFPNNWQVHFSDLEGKPKTYNAYFSCIKGARILWFEDSAYPTGYTGYAKIK